mmetsp:Transcript_9333/g.28202  ORF Transcript_9333/g.28202 Transcript_9333/m.28202 type:complete len:390 (+) Transcript_9333:340-1509(+)
MMFTVRSNNTSLTIKSSPPKTAGVATRLGVRAGALTKRNEQQSWQRRYCVLVPQTLLYYFDGERSEQPRGIIDLEYYTEVEVVARRTIRLSTPPDIPLRSFFFRAESDAQCAAWAAALARERYFVIADERDAYQRLQTEFQRQSAATADARQRLHAEAAARRGARDAAAMRRRCALAQLRAQAVTLGLSDSSAASLRVAADAVREVAHRLHYHARRAARLETAREATSATAQQLPSSRGGVLADLRERAAAWTDVKPRRHLGVVEDVLSLAQVAAARRARAREATARFAAEAHTARARNTLSDMQSAVAMAAHRRAAADVAATELADQRRILAREVRSAHARVCEARGLSSTFATRAESTASCHMRDKAEVRRRDLALRRAGLDTGIEF